MIQAGFTGRKKECLIKRCKHSTKSAPQYSDDCLWLSVQAAAKAKESVPKLDLGGSSGSATKEA